MTAPTQPHSQPHSSFASSGRNHAAAAAAGASRATRQVASSQFSTTSFEKSDDPSFQLNRIPESSSGEETEGDEADVHTMMKTTATTTTMTKNVGEDAVSSSASAVAAAAVAAAAQQIVETLPEFFAKAFNEKRVVYLTSVSEYCLREDVQRFFSGLNIENGLNGIIPVYNRALRFNCSFYVIFETEEHATRAIFRRNTMLGAQNVNVLEANAHGFAEALKNLEPTKDIQDRAVFLLAHNFPDLETDEVAVFLKDFEVDSIKILDLISPLRYTKVLVTFSSPEEVWRVLREKNRCFFKSRLMEISLLK